MGNVETHDLAPVRDDERKELNLARKITYKQYKKHINGEAHEACLTEIPWNIRDSISLYERMTVAFNAITEIPPELPLRIPHLNYLDLSHNQLETLPESFGLMFHLKTLIVRNNKIKSLPSSFVHLVKLEKIDLSTNMLRELPEEIGSMESISKLNVSDNKLKTLPISLGNSETIKMVLALNNRLQDPSQSICDEGSEVTLNFLRKRYKSVNKGILNRPSTPLNNFPRVRGNQLHSSVPNPHSAHVQYIQSQTHTTNTPSRIKTPLMPPLDSSQLDPGILRDKVIGLLYGAAIGDAIGIATRGMSADECSFHYNPDFVTYTDIVQDERRVRWRQGDWTSNFDLMALVLDSLIGWAGVVDELDFAKRLLQWCKTGFKELGDSEGILLSQTIQKVTANKDFASNPHGVSKHLESMNQIDVQLENGSITSDDDKGSVSSVSSMSGPAWKEYKAYLRSCSKISLTSSGCDLPGLDNGAIVRTAVLGIPSFHNLSEVVNNTVRICRATHSSPLAVGSSVVISIIVALLLQGKQDIQSTKGLEELISQARDLGREYLESTEEKADFEYYCSLHDLDRLDVKEFGKMGYCLKPVGAALIGLRSKMDFKSYIMKLIMLAGDANSNGCVAGAVLGCKIGYSHLPKEWVGGLRPKQTKWLNVKVNLLLDMMGLP